MGREIRKVPKGWNHPKRDSRPDSYQPMFERSYLDAITEWIEEHQLWVKGQHPDQPRVEYKYYAEWAGDSPNVEYYFPEWKEEELTCYQVYETVSEGTPVTPVFEKQEDLVNYLIENGDFWDQSRRKDNSPLSMPCSPWTKKQAERFVYGTGWAPSGMVINGKCMSGVQGMAETTKEN